MKAVIRTEANNGKAAQMAVQSDGRQPDKFTFTRQGKSSTIERKIIDHNPVTRRTAFKALGAVVALPWLESFGSAKEAVKPPVRLGFVYVPNGVDYKRWHDETPEGPLGELSTALKPLEPLKNHLTLLRGLALDQGRGHGDVGGDHARETPAS